MRKKVNSNRPSPQPTILEDCCLLTEMVRSLVDYPEEASVEERGQETETSVFVIRCAAEDRGKIIGKSGATISSLRSLFGRIAAADKRRVFIEVADSRLPKK